MNESIPETNNKKLLENPILGNLMVPIAIVLVGALIIFGVTKLLSTERTHKDLVLEMQSKTFGNRWIAAYELSKLISTKQIPEQDIPWLIDNMGVVLKDAKEPRTRKFIVTALGALRNPLVLPYIKDGLSDSDPEVRFSSVVALSGIAAPINFDWEIIKPLLETQDIGLIQVILLTLATHRVEWSREILISFLNHEQRSLRFSAATGLINFKERKAEMVIKEIFKLTPSGNAEKPGFTSEQVERLKLNILVSLEKNTWLFMNDFLENVAMNDKSLRVSGKVKEILNVLKN